MKCPTCGTTVEPGIAYCPNCGHRLAPSSAGAQTVLLPDQPADQPVPDASEGQTMLLHDVPLPPTGSRTTQPLDPRVPLQPQQSPFGVPPADSAPSYAPPYTPPASGPPYTPPASVSPYTPNQSYAPYQTAVGQMPVTVPTSTAAVISLIFGILSWSLLPVISPFVAVIAGHMARREIRNSQGVVRGNGLATAGLILGYLSFTLLLLFCVLAAIGFATSNK